MSATHGIRPLGGRPLHRERAGQPRVLRNRHLRRVGAGLGRGAGWQDEPRGAHCGGALRVLQHGVLQRPRQVAGTPPTTLDTTAAVTFVPGTGITEIKLSTGGVGARDVARGLQKAAEEAKDGCPVEPGAQGRAVHHGRGPPRQLTQTHDRVNRFCARRLFTRPSGWRGRRACSASWPRTARPAPVCRCRPGSASPSCGRPLARCHR